MLDLLIKNATVITMEGKGLGIIPNGAVSIKGNKIVEVGKYDSLTYKKAHREIDAENKVVMPGLIDAHIHTGIAILRGLSQDVDNWMEGGLWPFAKALDEQGRIKGSMVNIIEGIKAGTTTFCDYDNPMDKIVENHAAIGSRAVVADTINEMPEKGDIKVGELYPLDPAVGQQKFKNALNLMEKWHGYKDGRIRCLMGPQGPDMMSKELLLEVKEVAKKYNTKIHMHVAQGDREILQMEKRYGKRSIQYLDEIGYLDEMLLAVHLTEATAEETKLVAQRGASMILCSGSIGIIDGIVPPAAEFIKHSERLALGSDQAPGNNCNNMFNEMKFTSILNKCNAKDPKAFPSWEVLKMATINAAKALGMEDEIGSIAPGKKADVIIVDTKSPAMFPALHSPQRNIVPNLVYSASGSEVESVIIDGKVVMEDRKLISVDEKQAVQEGQEAAEKIAKRAEEFYDSMETTLSKKMKEGLL
ncbi:amidohydrolase [Proteinivorax hydrogeniformans]|uniref:Amidohydrolase n=1 Tax=Proteinivorax hydrogeniformans TaxID=1826727 RepID=A0AAU8HSF3_9FIRM